MAERRGIFAGIRTWFAVQQNRYKIQGIFAQRDRDVAEYLNYQNNKFAQIDAMGMDPYETAIAKYSFRAKEAVRFDEAANARKFKPENITETMKTAPELVAYANVGFAQGDYMKATEYEQELTGHVTDGAELQRNQGGRGIGAFLGRLVNGRLRESTRRAGEAQYVNFEKDTMYSSVTSKEVCKLRMHEQDIRKGRTSVDYVLSDDCNIWELSQMTNGERNEMAQKAIESHDKKMTSMRERPAQAARQEAPAKEDAKKEISADAITKSPEEREKSQWQSGKFDSVPKDSYLPPSARVGKDGVRAGSYRAAAAKTEPVKQAPAGRGM